MLGGLVLNSGAEASLQRTGFAANNETTLQNTAEGKILSKDFEFRIANGALELLLQEQLDNHTNKDASHPAWISKLLTHILAKLGDENLDNNPNALQKVHELCVADRQFILLQWRLNQSPDSEWLTAQCLQCDAFYNFPMDWRALPIKSAAPQFPVVKVAVSFGSVDVRVPNGGDQEFIARWLMEASIDNKIQKSPEDISLALARRLIIAETPKRAAEIGLLLTADDVNAIELAVESIAPELADRITLECPECGSTHEVILDLYRSLLKPVNHLLDDVHHLAVNYHWSETEILAMPNQRRLAYLQRLEKEKGFAGAMP